MVERSALGIARRGMFAVGAGVERDIGGVAAEVNRTAAIAGGAAPTFVPAEDRRQDAGSAVGIDDGQIDMLDEGDRKRGVWGKSGEVRVVIGGGRNLTNKTKEKEGLKRGKT